MVNSQDSNEPVALVRTWHKGEEQHAELLDWRIGIDALPDGEHTLYTAPPKLVPLTEEEIEACRQQGYDHDGLHSLFDFREAARAIERALEEKNGR